MSTFASYMNRNSVIPQHIAIIMDGNGRWAKQRGKDRSEGHFAGMMALKQTIIAAAMKGVKWLTVYAFSTENWGRPQAEVEAVMRRGFTAQEEAQLQQMFARLKQNLKEDRDLC